MRTPVSSRQTQARQPMARPLGTPMKGVYTCPELLPNADRPAGTQALALPSRMNNRLHYRDGRVTDLQGNPITPSKPNKERRHGK